MLDFLFTLPLPYPVCFITIAIGGRTEKKLYSQHLCELFYDLHVAKMLNALCTLCGGKKIIPSLAP